MAAVSENPWPVVHKNPVARGAFIVIEGLDRTGKTTQVKKLCDRLYNSGYNVESIRFPDRTSPIGKMIDNYLQSSIKMEDHVIHLLFSANRWEKAKWIEDTLAQGCTIVCDRYYYSGMTYSAAKENPNLSIEWAKTPDIGLPKPDQVIYLDLEPEEAEKRGGYGDEKYEKRDIQQRVRNLFLGFIGSQDQSSIVKVDAGASIDVVEQGIWAAISHLVDLVAEGHYGTSVGKFL